MFRLPAISYVFKGVISMVLAVVINLAGLWLIGFDFHVSDHLNTVAVLFTGVLYVVILAVWEWLAPERKKEAEKPLVPTVEWHYAPLSGDIAKRVDGEWVKSERDWAQYHREMGEFLRLRAAGELRLSESCLYGHPFFHGHCGQVDIYVPVTGN